MKKKIKKIKPRDHNVIAMLGKSRVLKDKRVQAKRDKVGRKVKHKSRVVS